MIDDKNDVLGKERISVFFYLNDIKSIFTRKSDNKKLACIGFPKKSDYHGYVWYYPKELIWQNKKDNNLSLSPNKRWVNIPISYQVKIYKSIKNTETNKWEMIDEKAITSSELKENMKRPYSFYYENQINN